MRQWPSAQSTRSAISLVSAAHGPLCRNSTGRPIRWLHFPKAGTSFVTTIYHFACPCVPAEEIYIPSEAVCRQQIANAKRKKSPSAKNTNASYNYGCKPRAYTLEHRLFELYPPSQWCPLLQTPFAGHVPVNPSLGQSLRLVAMFRHPATRLRSLFTFVKTVNWGLLRSHGAPPSQCPPSGANVSSLQEFMALGNWTGGCQVKMLLGHYCFSNVSLHEPELRLALSMVSLGSKSNAFEFVGLTDHWEVSVRLFHCKLGSGAVLPAELVNSRPGPRWMNNDMRLADGASLDFEDAKLLDAVSQRFTRELTDCGIAHPSGSVMHSRAGVGGVSLASRDGFVE